MTVRQLPPWNTVTLPADFAVTSEELEDPSHRAERLSRIPIGAQTQVVSKSISPELLGFRREGDAFIKEANVGQSLLERYVSVDKLCDETDALKSNVNTGNFSEWFNTLQKLRHSIHKLPVQAQELVTSQVEDTLPSLTEGLGFDEAHLGELGRRIVFGSGVHISLDDPALVRDSIIRDGEIRFYDEVYVQRENFSRHVAEFIGEIPRAFPAIADQPLIHPIVSALSHEDYQSLMRRLGYDINPLACTLPSLNLIVVDADNYRPVCESGGGKKVAAEEMIHLLVGEPDLRSLVDQHNALQLNPDLFDREDWIPYGEKRSFLVEMAANTLLYVGGQRIGYDWLPDPALRDGCVEAGFHLHNLMEANRFERTFLTQDWGGFRNWFTEFFPDRLVSFPGFFSNSFHEFLNGAALDERQPLPLYTIRGFLTAKAPTPEEGWRWVHRLHEEARRRNLTTIELSNDSE